MNVLVINAGSSSLKYQLMNPETGDVSAKGLCERFYSPINRLKLPARSRRSSALVRFSQRAA